MLIEELYRVVPAEEPSQYNARRLIAEVGAAAGRNHVSVLDLGCGDGRSFEWFKSSVAAFSWKGLDIEDSPEVRARSREDLGFVTYNGIEIPFPSESFDVVFSNQVFEHVRHPRELLGEIRRVLKPDGVFIGSVSYLEPFHSYSYFNFTPYGWYELNKEAGLKTVLLAAGIDGISLIRRSLLRSDASDSWWTLSPINKEIIEQPELSAKQKNYRMLMAAGHIVFRSTRD